MGLGFRMLGFPERLGAFTTHFGTIRLRERNTVAREQDSWTPIVSVLA